MHNLHTQRLDSCKKENPTEVSDSTSSHHDQTGASKAGEGGYPSSRPSNASASPPRLHHMPVEERNRRSRWRQGMPESTSSPPVGVEPATTSPSSGQPSQEERPTPARTCWRRNPVANARLPHLGASLTLFIRAQKLLKDPIWDTLCGSVHDLM